MLRSRAFFLSLFAFAVITPVNSYTKPVKLTVERGVAAKEKVISHAIKRLREDDESLKVIFEGSNEVCSLARDHGDFESLSQKLQEALRDKVKLSVTVDAESCQILSIK